MTRSPLDAGYGRDVVSLGLLVIVFLVCAIASLCFVAKLTGTRR